MTIRKYIFLLYREVAVSLLLLVVCLCAGCSHSGPQKSADLSDNVRSVWGDSAVVLQVSKPQNGYQVSFISNKDLIIAHFERGDSISRYCALEWLPDTLKSYEHAAPGVYTVDLDIPIIKVDTLGGSKIPKSGDTDLLEWYFEHRREFPPVHILAHYLKNIYLYSIENGLMDKHREEMEQMQLPFNFRYIPLDYPQPEYFIQ